MVVVVIPLQEFGLSRGPHGCVELRWKRQADFVKLFSQAKALQDGQSFLAQP